MSELYDAIVIGGGAAGSSAATYIAGHGWKTLLIDKGVHDGYLGSMGRAPMFTAFPDDVSGSEIVGRLRGQVEKACGKFMQAEATEAASEEGALKVTADGETFTARAVVLATGAAARTGYLSGEKELFGRGVFHDAGAVGPSNAGSEIAVIGKSKLAAEEAIILSRYAQKVHFVIPSNRLDIDNRILSLIQNDQKIELHFSTSIKSINGHEHVNSITVFTSGQEKEVPISSVFTYMHDYQPMNPFIKNAVQTAPNGGIMVNDQFETSAAGMFACGDVLCAKPQLPAVSIAQGLLAGMSVDQFLAKK